MSRRLRPETEKPELLATWGAIHDRTEVHQLSERTHRDAVGPWSTSLACCSVLVLAPR